jgi:hypothetical protein
VGRNLEPEVGAEVGAGVVASDGGRGSYSRCYGVGAAW